MSLKKRWEDRKQSFKMKTFNKKNCSPQQENLINLLTFMSDKTCICKHKWI